MRYTNALWYSMAVVVVEEDIPRNRHVDGAADAAVYTAAAVVVVVVVVDNVDNDAMDAAVDNDVVVPQPAAVPHQKDDASMTMMRGDDDALY